MKRRIDKSNQDRTDLVELIDSYFLDKYKDDANAIIGHFGLGFYSSFMVSKKVEIISKSYKEGAKAVKWSCEGNPDYTMEEIEKDLKPAILTIQDIAEVIERWTKIPVTKITEAETQKLLNLEANLHKHIISQDEAVVAVSKAIRRNRAGLQSTKRPPSFIFVGPTGVGKTELAKALAYEMFGSEDNIIRVDMSEFMESHSTSKLIGSPPGYVGYDDAGQLTEKVKRKPYSILLFDEIEKAHPDVFNILLQVLDDGKLTDAQGNTVNFENTIIIMTSNAGSNLNNNSIGFGNQTIMNKDKILGALKDLFRPEFLNRLDEVIYFKALEKNVVYGIVELILKGGRGGKGNCHFATSTRQAPHFAIDGEKGKEKDIELSPVFLKYFNVF